jgi:hypothetical protein
MTAKRWVQTLVFMRIASGLLISAFTSLLLQDGYGPRKQARATEVNKTYNDRLEWRTAHQGSPSTERLTRPTGRTPAEYEEGPSVV